MNPMLFLSQRLAKYTSILIIGLIGLSIANATTAQGLPEKSKVIPMAQAPASIAGSWRLANMTEDPFPTPMVPVGDLTVEFANGKVFGSGGCNRFNGGYKTTGNQVAIGPLASTFMACEPAVMQQETRFLAALQGAQRYEVNDQGLQIFYKTDKASGVMRFTARVVPSLW